MTQRRRTAWLVFATISVVGATPAAAQDTADSSNTASLNGGEVDGVAAVNSVAGSSNQQANVATIAVGDQAAAAVMVSQEMTDTEGRSSGSASASVSENAFAGSHGWIAANVSAGSGNQQANVNVIAIGLGGEVATAALLNQTRASVVAATGQEDPETPDRAASIGDGAFQDSSGLVQLSVVAGDRNESANIFSLSVPALEE